MGLFLYSVSLNEVLLLQPIAFQLFYDEGVKMKNKL